MDEQRTTDWWLWQMYRLVAEYVNDPTDVTESRLKALILEYRNHQHQHRLGLKSSHDWVVDFR